MVRNRRLRQLPPTSVGQPIDIPRSYNVFQSGGESDAEPMQGFGGSDNDEQRDACVVRAPQYQPFLACTGCKASSASDCPSQQKAGKEVTIMWGTPRQGRIRFKVSSPK